VDFEEAVMTIRVVFLPWMLLLGIMMLGCEPTTPVANSTNSPPAPPPPPGTAPPAPPAAAPLPVETKVGVFAGSVDDLAAPAGIQQAPPVPPADAQTERVKAQAGVGIKGRSLDEYEGVVVTPVKSYFAAKERIVFEIQFPSQYQLYKAMEDKVPKDFDDLKAKVLDPYQIKLPELPMGHRYIWDAATEQLMVERPKLKQ
jgi:hypothetical protein